MAKKQAPKAAEEGILVDAAKMIGHAAGKIASLAGGGGEHKSADAATSRGRLPKKNKSRLPRRQKKALKKRNNVVA